MICKCGHSINLHNHNGCQHIDRPNEMDLVCKCWITPELLAESKLAALRAAAEGMAERLRALRSYQYEINMLGTETPVFTEDDSNALAKWEALK